MSAGDVLIALPLADTFDDARSLVAVQQATGRRTFMDMFSRFSPASRHLREAVAGQRCWGSPGRAQGNETAVRLDRSC